MSKVRKNNQFQTYRLNRRNKHKHLYDILRSLPEFSRKRKSNGEYEHSSSSSSSSSATVVTDMRSPGNESSSLQTDNVTQSNYGNDLLASYLLSEKRRKQEQSYGLFK